MAWEVTDDEAQDHAKSNRSCPQCGRAGSFIDTPGAQWGYCDYCHVKWRILYDQFASSGGETNGDLLAHEKAIADYREVSGLQRIPHGRKPSS